MTRHNGFDAIRSLDYVIVLCDDLDKMRHFYKDLFRFHIEDEDPGKSVWFRVGTLFLGLRLRGRPYDGPKILEESAAIQLSFRVPPADVDIAYQTLKDKSIDVIEKPTNQNWHHRTLFFTDPENNVIEIYADIHPQESASVPSSLHQVTT